MAAPKKISLLPQEGFEYTTLGRVVTWSLSAGRIIVVLTELIVILTFLSRFWLDRQLTDLNEKIEEQSALIRTYQTVEKEWRAAQSKLKELSNLQKSSVKMEEDLQKITSSTPENIALSQVTVGKDAVQISGLAGFEGAIEGFINNLSSLNIGEVELTNLTVATQDQLGVRFTIVVTRQENVAKEEAQ